MADRNPSDRNDDRGSHYEFLQLTHKFEYLEYKVNNEKPLSIRISVLEEKVNNEINSLKKDLSETKSDAKFKMAERLTYIVIIVGLITTLLTLKYTGRI